MLHNVQKIAPGDCSPIFPWTMKGSVELQDQTSSSQLGSNTLLAIVLILILILTGGLNKRRNVNVEGKLNYADQSWSTMAIVKSLPLLGA